MAVNDDLPWNTTRCNRLLRPLSSKLAKLRKELEIPQSAGGERRNSTNASALKASPRRSAHFSQPARKPRGGPEKRADPDWMPGAGPTGAGRKTYGGRGAKKSAGIQRAGANNGCSARPGEIAFTPLLARTGLHLQDSPQLQNSPLKKFSTKNRGPLIARVEQIQELKKQMPTEIGNLVKGLSEAYANLLQATALGEEKRWKGTRSLLGACLRKMPDYIELEEYFVQLDKEEEDDDEDRDISGEIYTHLETQFETTRGQGWRPFKQMVRAHGTSLLCNAFADQIIGLETLHLLVSHCLNAPAWDEAEKFLWSFLPSLKPLSMPNSLLANLFDEQRSLYLWMVKDFVNRTGRYRFLYDQLEYMISQELLPLEWLATQSVGPVWDRLVRSLSDGDHRTQENAFRLLETAIYAGIGLPDESVFEDGELDTVARQFKPSSRQEYRDALDTTFSSLLTVLCSIALVNHNRDDSSGEHTMKRITWVLDSIVIDFLKRKDMRVDLELLGPIAENMQTFAQRAVWTIFACFLVHLEGCQLDAGMITLHTPMIAGTITWVASQYSSEHIDISSILATLPEFASSAARGTGKIWKDDGFDQIQRLVQGMLLLSGVRLPHKLWTMKRLALESATEFAHNTRDAEHIGYARDIEKTMRTRGHVVIFHSPQKNESPSAGGGFRWEEGIGEWVTCTPFAKQDVKRVTKKPLRALELLRTPEPSSQDNASDAEELPAQTPSIAMWANLDHEDDDDAFPQSSPVKKVPRISISSLGKRSRSHLTMVLVPSKRARMSPPGTPVVFYPELPRESLDPEEEGVRRSRRSKNAINISGSGLRIQRSRSSGLRNLQRRTYEEVNDIDIDIEGDSSNSDDSDPSTSFSSSSSMDDKPQTVPTERAQPSLHKRCKQQAATDDDNRDELSKTPGIKRRTSGRQVQGMREWWKVDGGMVEDAGSEDELSFQ
ncbi:hypothetical protein K458DRAFT_421517 [Lentithecium fluviatile CBS 122367]|uniref:Uncharacterized protein n=1 Tax=Lentithecium fluviatile CBS 122367 TaxID=1168545 RepID=A0A6G1IQZ4_9PLEO|nr:hypothetical protein K458DRAFT_421517 [Lentithecium fluviatile CBS 122367]